MFALLRSQRSQRAWADAVPFCLAQLAGAATGAAPLPAYVQDNMLNLLSGILKVHPWNCTGCSSEIRYDVG